jgi:hypothetical protein
VSDSFECRTDGKLIWPDYTYRLKRRKGESR